MSLLQETVLRTWQVGSKYRDATGSRRRPDPPSPEPSGPRSQTTNRFDKVHRARNHLEIHEAFLALGRGFQNLCC